MPEMCFTVSQGLRTHPWVAATPTESVHSSTARRSCPSAGAAPGGRTGCASLSLSTRASCDLGARGILEGQRQGSVQALSSYPSRGAAAEREQLVGGMAGWSAGRPVRGALAEGGRHTRPGLRISSPETLKVPVLTRVHAAAGSRQGGGLLRRGKHMVRQSWYLSAVRETFSLREGKHRMNCERCSPEGKENTK